MDQYRPRLGGHHSILNWSCPTALCRRSTMPQTNPHLARTPSLVTGGIPIHQPRIRKRVGLSSCPVTASSIRMDFKDVDESHAKSRPPALRKSAPSVSIPSLLGVSKYCLESPT